MKSLYLNAKEFPKSFRITKCKTKRNDCFFEYSSPCGTKWTGFEICIHGAIALWELFLEHGYSELEPKLEFADRHSNHPNNRK